MHIFEKRWYPDEHPIASCFFACVGHVTNLTLDKHWWGHQFIHVPWGTCTSEGIVNLGALDVAAENTYGKLSQSKTYKKISFLYGIVIDVQKYRELDSYCDQIYLENTKGKPFLLPIPLNRREGFVEPTKQVDHHYAIAEWLSKREILIYDRYRSQIMSVDELKIRLSWFLDRYGYLSKFTISRDASFEQDKNIDVKIIYQNSLDHYYNVGKEVLNAYVMQAEEYAQLGIYHKLPIDHLYTIPMSLKSEIRFIRTHAINFEGSFITLIGQLEKQWSACIIKATANTHSKKSKRFPIDKDLTNLSYLEEKYFSYVFNAVKKGIIH